MSAAILLLAAILPGDGSVPTSTEMRQATLAELFRGSWFGNWSRAGQRDGGAFLHKGILRLPMTPPAKMRLTITEEGRGWFRGSVGTEAIVGIWKYERGRMMICSQEAAKGFPKRFEEGEKQDVLMLWERWNANGRSIITSGPVSLVSGQPDSRNASKSRPEPIPSSSIAAATFYTAGSRFSTGGIAKGG